MAVGPSSTLLFAAALIAACGGEDAGVDPCVHEGAPTLAANVAPLFAAECALSGCHGDRPEADLSLDGAASAVHAETVGVPSTTAPDLARIEPGDPDASFLVRKLERSFDGLSCVDDDCGVRMPNGGGALSAECIEMVRAWVTAGARED
jgi:hypothetical protein